MAIQVGNKEWCEAVENFEMCYPYERHDKEPEDLHTKGQVYQDGLTNKLFYAFLNGLSCGRCIYRDGVV